MTEPFSLIASIVIAGIVGFGAGICACAGFVGWSFRGCTICIFATFLRAKAIHREHDRLHDRSAKALE